jgi:hypothetical protein
MMPSSTKGNPASKRMGNQNLKARRAASWVAGEERKRARKAAQDAAHKRNVASGAKPWDAVREARRERRRRDPQVQRRAREYQEQS